MESCGHPSRLASLAPQDEGATNTSGSDVHPPTLSISAIFEPRRTRCVENTVLQATRRARPTPAGSPVLGFTSNLGKLLEEISSRMRCPALNRIGCGEELDGQFHRCAGHRRAGDSVAMRKRQRMMPSVRFIANPAG